MHFFTTIHCQAAWSYLCAVGLDKLNCGPMTGCGGQSGVTGKQWCRQRFCERQVHSIISGDIVTECPNA